MEDTYNFVNNQTISDDYMNKLNNGYFIQQIIITVDKQIINNNFDTVINIINDDVSILFFHKSIYFNNHVYYNILPFSEEYIKISKCYFSCCILSKYERYNTININVKLVKQDIKYFYINRIHIKDKYLYDIENNNYIISNIFDNLDDLKTYIIENSLLTLDNVNEWIKDELLEYLILTFYDNSDKLYKILYEEKINT